MTIKDELKKSIENEIEQCDNFLKVEKQYADLVPAIQQRKDDAVAKHIFVENVPDEILDELGKNLSTFQKNEEQQLRTHLLGLEEIPPESLRFLNSGPTGSNSAFSELAHTIKDVPSENNNNSWIAPAMQAFSKLAEEKAKKEYLPRRLNKLNDQLGYMFVIVRNNIDRARAGSVGIDMAAMQMRNFINQLWGNVAALARKIAPERRDINNLELRTQKDRLNVADCLSTSNEINKQKIAHLLEIMYSLQKDLSDTKFGKNLLNQDLDKLNSMVERWIILVDDIIAYVNLNIEALE